MNKNVLITPEYLSLKDLVAYSSTSVGTLRKWVKSGMPHYRFGRSLMVKRSDFDEWVKRFRVEEDREVIVSSVLDEVMREMGMSVRKRRVKNTEKELPTPPA